MKEEKKKSSKGKIIVIIVILVLIILGLAGYIVYDKDLLGLKGKETTEEQKEEIEEDITEQLDVNSDEVQELMDKAVKEYNHKIIRVSDFEDSDIVYYGIMKLLDEKCPSIEDTSFDSGGIQGTITEDELSDTIADMFGKNLKYDFVDTFENRIFYPSYAYQITHNVNEKAYQYVNIPFGGREVNYADKMVSAINYGDKIEVNVKAVAVICPIGEPGYVQKAYPVSGDYTNYENNIKDNLDHDWTYEDIEDTFDKADTYKFTFTKEDDHFVFSSMELIEA